MENKQSPDEFPRIVPVNVPLDGHGNPKFKFEVKQRGTPDTGIEKAVFINGEKLDFKIDISRFLEAKKYGPHYMAQIQKEIQDNFVKSVSEAVGRKVTVDEIKEATITGWI